MPESFLITRNFQGRYTVVLLERRNSNTTRVFLASCLLVRLTIATSVFMLAYPRKFSRYQSDTVRRSYYLARTRC